jgi:hypothetical protein
VLCAGGLESGIPNGANTIESGAKVAGATLREPRSPRAVRITTKHSTVVMTSQNARVEREYACSRVRKGKSMHPAESKI